MKKMMKKLIAMAAALVMIVTLLPAVGAKAAATFPTETTTGTITIKKTDSNGNVISNELDDMGNFKLYQIASVAQQKGEDNTFRLVYTTTNADVISQEALNTLISKADSVSYVSNIAENLQPVKDQLKDEVAALEKSSDLPFGLYLVVEDKAPSGYVAGAPFFVQLPSMESDATTSTTQWFTDVVAHPKNASNDLTKKIVLEDGTEVDNDTVSANSTITYKVSGTVPYLTEGEIAAEDAKISISDTLNAEGKLTFSEQNIIFNFYNSKTDKVEPIGQETLRTEDGDKSFTLEISDKDKLAKYTGKYFEVTYTVKVGAISAEDAANLNINKATISKNSEANPEQPEVPVYTFGIRITKTGVNEAGTDSEPLKDVTFGLYEDNNGTISSTAITTATTDKDGYLTFDGLDADDNNGAGTVYWLKEESTVNGYTLLANPIKVTLIPVISADGNSCTVNYKIDNQDNVTEDTDRVADVAVENQKGFSLPETGGMGTYLFTIGGIVIMAGAAFALIAMKKRA